MTLFLRYLLPCALFLLGMCETKDTTAFAQDALASFRLSPVPTAAQLPASPECNPDLNDVRRDYKLQLGNTVNIAGTKIRNKKYTCALKIIAIALSVNPNDANAFYQRSIAYDHLNYASDALIAINEAIFLSPNDTDFYDHRSDLYLKINDYDSALANADQAIAISLKSDTPSYPASSYSRSCKIRIMIGRDLSRARNDCRSAIEILERNRIQYRSKSGNYNDRIGFMNLIQKNWSAALSAYDRSIEDGTGQPESYYGRGVAELGLGKTEKGAADIARAKDERPDIESIFAPYKLIPPS